MKRFAWRKTFLLSSVALFVLLAHVVAQSVITTYVGPQMPASGSTAFSQAIDYPTAAVPDGNGGVYILSRNQNRVYDVSASGILTVTAGSSYGFGGDGGPATDAMLASPVGLAIDSSGNLYIADTGNNRVRKVTKDGIITTFAGNGGSVYVGDGGPAAAAGVPSPMAVAVDPVGNVYVSDINRVTGSNGHVRKISLDGKIATLAGGPTNVFPATGMPAISAGLSPTGIAVDGAGNLYIADSASGLLLRVGPDGIITVLGLRKGVNAGRGGFSCVPGGDGGPVSAANVCYLNGLAVDGAGNLYLTDGNLIREVTTDGIIQTLAGTGNLSNVADGIPAISSYLQPFSVAVDSTGNLYVAEAVRNDVRRTLPDKTITTVVANNVFGFTGDGGPATLATISSPGGLALDRAGNLYVADTGNIRVRKVAPDGTITTIAGNGTYGAAGDGGPATMAQLRYPQKVSVDDSNNVYILDDVYVHKVTTDGLIHIIEGCTGACAATALSFNLPNSLSMDAAHNLYVSQIDRIWKIDPAGVMTILIANNDPGFGGDGGVPSANQPFHVSGFAVDPTGGFYVSGTGNAGPPLIYRIPPGGPIKQIATFPQIQLPTGMRVDAAGNLYVADYSGVLKISPAGTITKIAGVNPAVAGFSGDGGLATSAQLNMVYLNGSGDVAVDAGGNVYVTDVLNYRVRKISPSRDTRSFSLPAAGGHYETTSLTNASLDAGYGILQPNGGSVTPYGVAVFSYRPNGVLISETAVPASPLRTSGRIYAESNGPVRTGIAIANPGDQDAAISFYFTDQSGTDMGSGAMTLPAHEQYAAFLDQAPYKGTAVARSFTFTSSVPVGAIALRGFVNERSEALMTTLPIAPTPTSSVSTDPIILPHFAAGAGWTTRVLLVNPTDSPLSGTVDFDATYSYSIAPRSATTIISAVSNVLRTGNVSVTPSQGTPAPVVSSVFTLTTNGITVTETGVATSGNATSFRIFAELDASQSLRTGIAMANTSGVTANLHFDLLSLDGRSTGSTGSTTIPPNSHLAMFLDEIPGMQNLPANLRGILHVTSDQPISAIGFRIRYNERKELVLATTPAVPDSVASTTDAYVFPQVVSGMGFSTEFILINSGVATDGTVTIKSQNGAAMPVFVP
jgi:sugar lactone lactonase YvrE